MIVSAAIPLDHPLRARPTALCWACGREVGTDRCYVALPGAPWPLWVHTHCSLSVAWHLVGEWRAALMAEEHEA